MQAFCGFSAVFLAFIIPYFDDFCTVYRMIGIVQFTLVKGEGLAVAVKDTLEAVI